MRIRTKQGHYYDVTKEGHIIRLDQKDFQPSGQWRLVGIDPYNRNQFREFVPFKDIAKWLATKPDFKFKNGNPRYTVRDYDHGTIRNWGDGIASIWWESEVSNDN